MEVIRQQEGPKSSVRLQVAAVSCDECGAIPWDELQVGNGFQLFYMFLNIFICLLIN